MAHSKRSLRCLAVVVAVLSPAPAGAESRPLAFRSATDLRDALRAREWSSRELLADYRRRVDRYNGALGAVVATDWEHATTRAAAADRALAAGESWGPLHGLPITVKEFFATPRMPTTCGDLQFADYRAESYAPSVQRLVDAGAIVFGKTNVPYHGLDWQSFNALHGQANNPWDLDRTPGGSSGGSAAAVAAGLTAFELGSDIGGSIRVPAHFNGVYGHKPTYGLISPAESCPGFGRGAQVGPMVVAGPITRSAQDLALLFAVLATPQQPLPSPRHRALADFRVALWFDEETIETDRAQLAVLERAAEALRETGARIDRAARPAFRMHRNRQIYGALLYHALWGAPLLGTPFVEEQNRIKAAWAQFFERFDVVLAPVFGVSAFAHDHSFPFEDRRLQINGGSHLYEDQIRWPALASVGELPVTVAPVGFDNDGLPVGVQIIGPRFGDRTTIEFARLLGEVIGGYRIPPDFQSDTK